MRQLKLHQEHSCVHIFLSLFVPRENLILDSSGSQLLPKLIQEGTLRRTQENKHFLQSFLALLAFAVREDELGRKCSV